VNAKDNAQLVGHGASSSCKRQELSDSGLALGRCITPHCYTAPSLETSYQTTSQGMGFCLRRAGIQGRRETAVLGGDGRRIPRHGRDNLCNPGDSRQYVCRSYHRRLGIWHSRAVTMGNVPPPSPSQLADR